MRKNLTIVFLSLILLTPAVSHAARDYGSSDRVNAFFGEVYLGVTYGSLKIEDVPDSDGSDIRNLGFAFGKGINKVLAMELAFNNTVSEDDTSIGDLSADTLGLFLVARTPGRVYFKGRAGYTRTVLERNTGGNSFDHNNYGMAYSGALGVKIVKGSAIELEYTLFPSIDNSRFTNTTASEDNAFFSVSYVLGLE